jgi:hydrogenase expression/formation protein HypC
MCLGIPYEVIEVLEDEQVLVRVGSGTQSCFAGLVPNVKEGDWLVVHAGFAIEKITPEDARPNLEFIRQAISSEEAELARVKARAVNLRN